MNNIGRLPNDAICFNLFVRNRWRVEYIIKLHNDVVNKSRGRKTDALIPKSRIFFLKNGCLQGSMSRKSFHLGGQVFFFYLEHLLAYHRKGRPTTVHTRIGCKANHMRTQQSFGFIFLLVRQSESYVTKVATKIVKRPFPLGSICSERDRLHGWTHTNHNPVSHQRTLTWRPLAQSIPHQVHIGGNRRDSCCH